MFSSYVTTQWQDDEVVQYVVDLGEEALPRIAYSLHMDLLGPHLRLSTEHFLAERQLASLEDGQDFIKSCLTSNQ